MFQFGRLLFRQARNLRRYLLAVQTQSTLSSHLACFDSARKLIEHRFVLLLLSMTKLTPFPL